MAKEWDTDHLLVCAIIIRREKESFHHTNLSEKCFLCSYCLRGLCPFSESFQYSAAMMSTHLSMPITPLSSVK